MPHGLPAADSTPLERSPLQLVVCQIKFEETLAVADGRLILAFHEALGGARGPYPKVEQIRGSRLDIPVSLGAPARAPSETPFTGWRMQSSDGWIVTIMPDSAALETTRYTTWSADFQPRLSQLMAAVAEHIKPATEQRLGLRYVDRIADPPVSSPSEWRGLVTDEFLGPILHPTLGPLVRATQQQIILDLGDGIRAIVRTATALDPSPNERPAFVLDFDVFREGVLPFDSSSIEAAAADFHDLNLRLFQQATTQGLRNTLSSRKASARGR